jgi:hypothetical protein
MGEAHDRAAWIHLSLRGGDDMHKRTLFFVILDRDKK